MAKPKLRVAFHIPPYCSPRSAWRQQIHEAAAKAIRHADIDYGPQDLLELDVHIYLKGRALKIHDVDNRLKDVMDALQGHVAGTTTKRRGLPPLIPNDRQIFRVVVEKGSPPPQSHGFGHVTISSHAANARHRARKAVANPRVEPTGMGSGANRTHQRVGESRVR